MRELPPRIPPEMPDLKRAVSLLGGAYGATAKHRRPLGAAREAELEALIEARPMSRTEGRNWFLALRKLWRSASNEQDPEADDGS